MNKDNEEEEEHYDKNNNKLGAVVRCYIYYGEGREEGEALKGATPSSSVSLAQRIDILPNQT